MGKAAANGFGISDGLDQRPALEDPRVCLDQLTSVDKGVVLQQPDSMECANESLPKHPLTLFFRGSQVHMTQSVGVEGLQPL